MTTPRSKPLTDRQRAVMERVDRRVPIKVIAQDLGVSETRINQHIRALKDIFDAASLGELVELYRVSVSDTAADLVSRSGAFETLSANSSGQYYAGPSAFPLPNGDGSAGISVSAKISGQGSSHSHLVQSSFGPEFGTDEGRAGFVMGSIVPMFENAPWFHQTEAKILDGQHAILLRLGAIGAIALAILAAAALTSAAASSISEVLYADPAITADTTEQSDAVAMAV